MSLSVTVTADDDGTVSLPVNTSACLATVRSVCGRGTNSGGVLPFCTDSTTGRCHFLLGVSLRGRLCHFHGRVDEGESLELGAAREGYEESKGIFGSTNKLWRFICSGDTHSVRYNARGMFGVFLGDLSKEKRIALRSSFHAAPAFYGCMNEAKDVVFVDIRDIISLSTPSASYLVPDADYDGEASGWNKEYPVRSFLHGWFSNPRFWSAPIVLQWLSPLLEHNCCSLQPILLYNDASDEIVQDWSELKRGMMLMTTTVNPLHFMCGLGVFRGTLRYSQRRRKFVCSILDQLCDERKEQSEVKFRNSFPVAKYHYTTNLVSDNSDFKQQQQPVLFRVRRNGEAFDLRLL
eukprot:PhM_4_TR17498/c0_g1_i1/m.44232